MRLHRRELLLAGAGALAVKATSSVVACAADPVDKDTTKKADAKGDSKMEEHEGHDEHKGHDAHKGHEGHGAADAGKGGDMALVNTVADCIAAGQACLSHCIRLLASGDTSMGDCAKAVNDMLAICRASESLAASGSKHLKGIAKLCIEACSDCAKACGPHAGHHAECKACKEACDATVEAMKAV
jgi:Cys-rich four helix bundle protein (predicted Tat secretion target)